MIVPGCSFLDHRAWTTRDDWYNPPPPRTDSWHSGPGIIPTPVSNARITDAANKLAIAQYVPLTLTEATELGYQGPASSGLYLVRAVSLNQGTGAFRVRVLAGGDILVTHASLGRSPVPMHRHPVIVQLDSPPKTVYVDCGMAE